MESSRLRALREKERSSGSSFPWHESSSRHERRTVRQVEAEFLERRARKAITASVSTAAATAAGSRPVPPRALSQTEKDGVTRADSYEAPGQKRRPTPHESESCNNEPDAADRCHDRNETVAGNHRIRHNGSKERESRQPGGYTRAALACRRNVPTSSIAAASEAA